MKDLVDDDLTNMEQLNSRRKRDYNGENSKPAASLRFITISETQ